MHGERHDLFVDLFVRNQDRVYRFILTLVPNRADAEELFQQTNLTLWKTWDRFEPDQDFVRWACGIAHNHVRNFVRKARGSQVLLSEALLERLASDRLEHDGYLEERRQALAGCLEKLPAGDKAMIERCYGGRESFKSLAEHGGLSPNVFYKTLRRIRTTLHACVTQTLALEVG